LSLGACIPDLLASGKIRKADAEKADRTYKRHYEALRGSMGDEAAAAEATTRALAEIDAAAKLQRRQAGLAILAQQAMDKDMDAGVAKGIAPHRALTQMLRQVEIGRERIENQAHEGMLDFIERHRRNLLGQAKDKTGLLDVVRELHGQGTGNATAAAFAKGVADQFERLRLAFNRQGGAIGQRADYGMPHRYDPLKVRDTDFEDVPRRLLSRARAGTDDRPAFGRRVHAGAARGISVRDLHQHRDQRAERIGRQRRARLAHARQPGLTRAIFVFKDGDAWLRIAAKYGDGNPFEAIMSHVHGMARDIAFMERFGPNPAASWKRGIERADRIAANSAVGKTGAIKGRRRPSTTPSRCGGS
jgi:hypothetical protein